jgi:membrane-associated protein
LVTAGLFSARGDLSVSSLLISLSLAAILGDTLGYNIGARTGPRLFSRPDSWLFNRKHLLTTKEFYERHGPFTIVIARFVPIVRTFAPFVAGVGSMTYGRFILYNVFGGLLWCALFIFLGYFFGNLPFVKKNFEIVIVAIILISLLPPVIEYFQSRRKKAAPGQAPQELPGSPSRKLNLE